MLNNTDASTYNNMKEAKKALYQMAVIPELLKIQDELNRWLAPRFGDKLCVEYDFTSIPEMQEETEKVVDQLSKAWWITPNEKREVMSYGVDNENEALDDYYVPANLIPIKGSDLPEEQVAEVPAENNNEEVKALLQELLQKQTYSDYPQAATNNAKRMLEWREKYGRDEVRGGTEVGWQRANQLASREALSVNTISRMAQFNRHRENAKVAEEYKDTPWKDNGYVAWNLWGGTAGVDWAIRKMEKLRND
jgi:hypothetical protein